ncbi:MAG: helix-turn-helix domain-containing protein [Roseburia sp.]|nr:helix-turn-helix domain-containing protein [Roseburia sp.]MCM1098393.1 helix-turn-helix domain-containing protein [Ruminococcus flavefaciens]
MAKPKHTIIESRSYNLPLRFPLLLLSGDHWKISDIPSDRLHFHNCMEIGLCRSDSGSLVVYDEPVPFRAGDVTVIPKNVPHTTYSTPGTESLWSYIFFDPKIMFHNMVPVSWKNYDLSLRGGRDLQIVFGQNDYPRIWQMVTIAIRELEEQKPNYQINVRCLLLSICIELGRIFSSGELGGANPDQGSAAGAPGESGFSDLTGPGEPEQKQEKGYALTIAPALDYIEQNYSQQFSIKYLADLCRWSPTHFRRVFRDIMHVSPLDYLNHTRITNACNLLQGTEDSILDISESVGFHSVSSFNRCFIKTMQMSPREYRRINQLLDEGSDSQSIVGYSGWMRPETPQKHTN